MKQLTQKLGNGAMAIIDVPAPMISAGTILVRNQFSVISAGTEGATVSSARKNLVGKALEKPEQVKQVIDTLQQQGIKQTYAAVAKRLDGYSPLGYSCAGEVVAVGADVKDIFVGDRVACGGLGHACHAELVSVPINLAVKLSATADLKSASYNTLGAIAMQGVRQAAPQIGETFVVIGLGLIGLLTSMILRASGVRVIGVDSSLTAIEFSKKIGVVDSALLSSDSSIEAKVSAMTSGYGADSVMITAGTSSLGPINMAGALSRKKGRVVVVGVVPTGFDRDPHWYRKELDLKMACSYGPGRYDEDYEEKGVDYPYAYVRWTENRNMQSFQDLISRGVIDVAPLTTHEFDFEAATDAYDLIMNRREHFSGIVLKYATEKDNDVEKSVERSVHVVSNVGTKNKGVSVIGVGNYAQGQILPNLPSPSVLPRCSVASYKGLNARRIAEKNGFATCTTDVHTVFDDSSSIVIVATRHDSHSEYVAKAVEAGKSVFVEKPLCINSAQLDELTELGQQADTDIMIGFNRRFSKLIMPVRNLVSGQPCQMVYRVNAGELPPGHWLTDLEIGGGRLVGEACHFIDLMMYLADSQICSVSASCLTIGEKSLDDSFHVVIGFENGSSGVLVYNSQGARGLAKEYLEVHCAGKSAILHDYRALDIYENKKRKKLRLPSQDKGQRAMFKEYFSKMDSTEKLSLIPVNEAFDVTRATLLAMESIAQQGAPIKLKNVVQRGRLKG